MLLAADDKKHRDKMAKHMPGLNSPTLNSRPLGRQAACIGPETSSVSSLAVSESEDDLNGKGDNFFHTFTVSILLN